MKYPIFSKDGVEKCHTNTLEYHGKWMGECFVQASVQSPEPVLFELGDYILYNGQKFEINYDPAVIKRASVGSVGDAFKYENIKFNSFSDELTRCRFLDFVQGDNNLHYSYLPKFNFFCADIKDFMMRIQANLDRMYDDWKIELTPNIECATNVQIDIDDKSVWEALECITTKFKSSFVVRQKTGPDGKIYKAIIIGEEVYVDHEMLQYGKGNGLKQIEKNSDSSQQIITRLRAYGSTKNIPYHYYTGTVDSQYGNVYTYEPWFRYTRRWKYDESKMAFGYVPYGTPYHLPGGAVRIKISLQGPFTENDSQYGIKFFFERTPNIIREATLIFDEEEQNAARKYLNNDEYVGAYIEYTFPTRGDWEHNAQLEEENSMVVISGIPKAILTQYKWIWYAPYPLAPSTMAINNLMLPDFLAYVTIRGNEGDRAIHIDVPSEREIFDSSEHIMLNPANCTRVYGSDNLTVIGFRYSDGNYYRAVYYRDPLNVYQVMINYDSYIEDAEAVAKYGIREGSVFFDKDDADNDISEIFPTIQGMKAEPVRNAGYVVTLPEGDNEYLDEILSGTDENGIRPVTDDGVPDDHSTAKTEPDNFTVYVKDLGFNPHDFLSTENMKIHMRSGMCGEREFELVDRNNNPKRVWLMPRGSKYELLEEYTDGALPAYEFVCVRDYDDALGLYFPNKDYPISGTLRDENRPEDGDKIGQIKHTDRFTIINIELPRLYVDAASQLLMQSAYEYLKNNSKPKLTLSPTLDPVYIAKDRDYWIGQGREDKSLHYALKEGNILRFKDEDLGIENGVDTMLFIDTLTIKEGNSVVPEYTLTLKEEKEFSTLQKIQNQITAVAGVSSNALTASQAMLIAKKVAAGGYISSQHDDVAEGTVRFKRQTIHDNGWRTMDFLPGMFGGIGAALTKEEQGYRMEVDYLSIRKRLEALEVQIQKMSHIGGQVILSAASATLCDVQRQENGDYRCYFEAVDGEGNEITNDWVVGDQARCQTFNLYKTQEGTYANQYWWRLVTEVSSTPEIIYDEEGNVVSKRHWFDVYGGNDIHYYDASSGVPQKDDVVTLLGHQGNDLTRCNAIIEAGAGTGSPYHRQYKGINQFALTQDMVKLNLSPENASLKVDSLSIVADGREETIDDMLEAKTESFINDVNKQLDQKFDIYQIEQEAPRYNRGEVKNPISVVEMSEIEPELAWAGIEARNHVGDFALFSDGVCYKFTENYEWVLINDKFLVAYVENLAEQQQKIADMESDNVVTPLEKQELLRRATSEYEEFLSDSIPDSMNTDEVVEAKSHWQGFVSSMSEFLAGEHGLLINIGESTNLNDVVWPIGQYGFTSLADGFSKVNSAKSVYKQKISEAAMIPGADTKEVLENMAADWLITMQEKRGVQDIINRVSGEYEVVLSEAAYVDIDESTINSYRWNAIALLTLYKYIINADGDVRIGNKPGSASNRLGVKWSPEPDKFDWWVEYKQYDVAYALAPDQSRSGWNDFNQAYDRYSYWYTEIRKQISQQTYDRSINVEDEEGLFEDFNNRLLALQKQYSDAVGTVLDMKDDMGILLTNDKQLNTASGMVTTSTFGSLFTQQVRDDGSTISAQVVTYINNGQSGVRINADKLNFNGAAINISASNDFRITSPQFSISKDGFVVNTQNLKVSADGKAEFSGELKAATGTFAGNLSAAKGTFAGELQAAKGTFSGELRAAKGTFSGELTAASGSFTGLVKNGKFVIDDSNVLQCTFNAIITPAKGDPYNARVISLEKCGTNIDIQTSDKYTNFVIPPGSDGGFGRERYQSLDDIRDIYMQRIQIFNVSGRTIKIHYEKLTSATSTGIASRDLANNRMTIYEFGVQDDTNYLFGINWIHKWDLAIGNTRR